MRFVINTGEAETSSPWKSIFDESETKLNRMEEKRMDLKTRNMNDGTMVIEVTGRLDAVTSPLFEKEIVAFLAKEKQGMALDFKHLDYISSSGLRALILGAKKAKANNGALVLFGLKQQVMEVFDISGFSSILTILPGEAEALAYIDHQLER